MKNSLIALAMVIGGSGANLALGSTYQLDADHSMAYFKIGHLGLTKIIGRFNTLAGTLTLNDANSMLTAADVTIQATSVDTGVARRDNHLRTADFFNVAQFPTLKFHVTNVASIDATHLELTGDFTLHGVTKPITVQATQLGLGADSQGNKHLGAEGSFTFKRSDFGMTVMQGAVGDEVEVFLSFDGVKQ